MTRYFLFCIPGILIAIAAGRLVNRRMRGEGFLQVVHVGLIVIGVTLMTQALKHGS